jgi:hypothetical protein
MRYGFLMMMVGIGFTFLVQKLRDSRRDKEASASRDVSTT